MREYVRNECDRSNALYSEHNDNTIERSKWTSNIIPRANAWATSNPKTSKDHYVTGFTMQMSGCEQPYGMLTSTMANLHNSTSTFTGPMATIISPLQGSGSAVNNLGRSTQPPELGFSAQLPVFTTNSAAILRQRMDESNHDMVHMLS